MTDTLAPDGDADDAVEVFAFSDEFAPVRISPDGTRETWTSTRFRAAGFEVTAVPEMGPDSYVVRLDQRRDELPPPPA